MSQSVKLSDLLNNAVALLEQGRPGQALTVLNLVLARLPDHRDAVHLAALAKADLGRHGEAMQALKALLADTPDLPEVCLNLAKTARRAEDRDCLRCGLGTPEQFSHLPGPVALQIGRLVLAGAGQEPAFPWWRHAQKAGAVCAADALDYAKIAVSQNAFVSAWAGLELYRSSPMFAADAAARVNWAHLRCLCAASLGCLSRYMAELIAMAEQTADEDLMASVLFHAVHLPEYDGPELKRLSERFVALLPARRTSPPSRSSLSPRPLKIGFFTSLFTIPLARFQTVPLIEALDRGRFDPVLISPKRLEPQTEDFYQDKGLDCVSFDHVDTVATFDKLAALGLDILVDIAGPGMGGAFWVTGMGAAPVTVSCYYATTGMAGCDAVMMSDHTLPRVPSLLPSLYTETAIRSLGTAIWNWEPANALAALPETPLPALKNGHITFGVFSALAKISDTSLNLWGRVLREFPDARVLLKNTTLARGEMRDHLTGRLQQAGIDPGRVTLQGPAYWKDHFTFMSGADVMLDSTPYTGSLTAADCLYLGIPYVTLSGNYVYANMGRQYLHYVGLADLVAEDEAAYVAKTVALARDVPRLKELRATLRQRLIASKITDAAGFAPRFEALLERLWHDRADKTFD